MQSSLFWFTPVSSVLALGVAAYFYSRMKAAPEGTAKMAEIASHVRAGAMAYLRQQYKVVGIFFLVLTLIFAWLAYGMNLQNHWVPFAFLTGGFFSGLFGDNNEDAKRGNVANAAEGVGVASMGPTNEVVKSVNGMRQRRLGGSDIVVSELGLGTQRW